jgi:ribonuclease HII
MKAEIDLNEIERGYWARGVRYIAGVDEAGRGPLAGPVVAAAVVFAPGELIPSVWDSKKIPTRKRTELYHCIRQKASAIGVGIISHEIIDRINILQATRLAMNKALDQLGIVPEVLLVDGNFFHHERYKVHNVIRGDTLSHTIAAASIIAKVTRDALMEEYDREYPEYGFARHKGYGTRAHVAAINRFGMSLIHRKSFHIHSWGEVHHEHSC